MHSLRPFSLPEVGFFDSLVQGVQHPLFITAPQRGDQVLLGAVSGEAVDDHPFRQHPQAVQDQVAIFLQVQGAEIPGGVVGCQIGPLQNV